LKKTTRNADLKYRVEVAAEQEVRLLAYLKRVRSSLY